MHDTRSYAQIILAFLPISFDSDHLSMCKKLAKRRGTIESMYFRAHAQSAKLDIDRRTDKLPANDQIKCGLTHTRPQLWY